MTSATIYTCNFFHQSSLSKRLRHDTLIHREIPGLSSKKEHILVRPLPNPLRLGFEWHLSFAFLVWVLLAVIVVM